MLPGYPLSRTNAMDENLWLHSKDASNFRTEAGLSQDSRRQIHRLWFLFDISYLIQNCLIKNEHRILICVISMYLSVTLADLAIAVELFRFCLMCPR